MTRSIIGENSFFEGKFYVKGELEIQGKCEALCIGVDHLIVGKTGKIKADIKASTITVEGIIIGNLKATVRIVLYPTAKVLGNISTPELIIQKGAIIEGKCTIISETEKSARDLILELYEGKEQK